MTPPVPDWDLIEDAERPWETPHWAGEQTMPDADRPAHHDDEEERDR